MNDRRRNRRIIACSLPPEMRDRIDRLAEGLKGAARAIAAPEMTEEDFARSGLFRAAVEKLRGQQVASTAQKRDFIAMVLVYMRDAFAIASWQFTGHGDRRDYRVVMPDGRVCVIEAKGCLDGNNTTIYERPPDAEEFVIWSLCQNTGADPNKNAWSGIQTRLSADVISRDMRVDALIIWDMLCGTIGRPCPKLIADPARAVPLRGVPTPPPCIYLFPRTVPNPRNNPAPPVHALEEVEFASALARLFGCDADDITGVAIEARANGNQTERRTRFYRRGAQFAESAWSAIRRVQ